MTDEQADNLIAHVKELDRLIRGPLRATLEDIKQRLATLDPGQRKPTAVSSEDGFERVDGL